MKTKEKKMILILGLITIIVVIFAVITGNENKTNEENKQEEVKEEFVEKLEDGTRLNTSKKLHETKKIDGMEISNFQVTEKGNVTVLLGTIKNTSESKKGGYPVDITILDKQGNEIIDVVGYIGELEPGQSEQLNVSASFDYANAYDFTIEKK